MNDIYLEQKIRELESLILNWAIKMDVWGGSSFTTYLDHINDEPNEISACVTILCPDGDLYSVIDGDYENLSEEFLQLIEDTEFFYERHDGYLCFYTDNEELNKGFLDYFEWQWISKLVQPDYTSLYEELYSYFYVNPHRLYSLTPRKFEILISELFRNQGYQTELGPGTGDGGVDLKLYQKDEIDQIVTLVQVKRYKESLPVKLEAVAGFAAIVDEQKANRGLFITTSRFLPVAKGFASRQQQRIVLADSKDVTKWCENVKTRIIRDKSQSLSDDYILNVIKNSSRNNLVGKVVVARTGYNMILNDFCLVIADSTNVALLMRLPRKSTSFVDPPYQFRGYEAPDINESILTFKTKENVFRAQKSISYDGQVQFWGQQNLYFIWDDTPQYFDWID